MYQASEYSRHRRENPPSTNQGYPPSYRQAMERLAIMKAPCGKSSLRHDQLCLHGDGQLLDRVSPDSGMGEFSSYNNQSVHSSEYLQIPSVSKYVIASYISSEHLSSSTLSSVYLIALSPLFLLPSRPPSLSLLSIS